MVKDLLYGSLLIAVSSLPTFGQTPMSQTQQSASSPSPTPALSSQVKKTVVYLRSDCLHDFAAELSPFNKAYFEQLSLPQEIQLVQKLVDLTSKLSLIKASVSKLNADDAEYLAHPNPLTNNPATLAIEGAWRASALLKMSGLTGAEIQLLTPEEYDIFPSEQHLGTGFLMSATLDMGSQNPAEELGLTYLVTNRHVIQPGVDVGKPCSTQLRSFLMINHKKDAKHPSAYVETNRIDDSLKWTLSTDESVDLAVTPLNISTDQYDFLRIPLSEFLTRDEMNNKKAVEGDPVFFAGMFIQFFDAKIQYLDPIVRSGTLAMVPEELLPTTIQRKPGHVFLADAHVFGGNSGSPVFVDTLRFTGMMGLSFKFLGVVSGEVFENNDLTFTVTTSIAGSVAANSDVSMVVPAWQILDILEQPDLKKARDDLFALYRKQHHVNSNLQKP